jgi:uncharacterized membrane protein
MSERRWLARPESSKGVDMPQGRKAHPSKTQGAPPSSVACRRIIRAGIDQCDSADVAESAHIQAENYARRSAPIRRVLKLAPVLIAFFYFTVALLVKYLLIQHYALGAWDTAFYENALWSVGKGEKPIVYVMPGVTSHAFTGNHFIPAGFVYGQLYRVAPGMMTTAVLEALAFAIASIFLYGAARRLTSSAGVACVVECLFLIGCTRLSAHFYPPDSWVVPFISAGLYFTTGGRYWAATCAWVLAMAHKEYFGLAIAVFGATTCLLALRKEGRRARFGFSWTVLGVVWFALGFLVIMPATEPWINASMFSSTLGDQPIGIGTVLPAGKRIIERLVSVEGLVHIGRLLLPFALLPLFGWEVSASVVPIVALNLMADQEHCTNEVVGHYTYIVFPFLAIGAALGWCRLQCWAMHWSKRFKLAGSIIVGAAVVLVALLGAKIHVYHLRMALLLNHALADHTRHVEAMLGRISSLASVAATEKLLPYLSHRPLIIELENVPSFRPDYVIEDALYDSSLLKHIGDVGLKMRAQEVDEMYVAADWSIVRTPIPVGYELVATAGSVRLFTRVPKQRHLGQKD